MVKINSINNKSQDLTIDPGVSGDAFIQFDINSTSEFRIGVDDTDSDSYKISQGSALGTNDTFIMTSAGARTLPLQPTFLAYLSSTVNNVTGDSTAYKIAFDSEITDIGSNFNTTTYEFTAPITGLYRLETTFQLTGVPSSGAPGSYSGGITTSNRGYTQQFSAIRIHTGGELSICFSVLADMDASDTAYVQFLVDASSKVVDVYSSGSSDLRTRFSGTLEC